MGVLSDKAIQALTSSEFELWWHSPGQWVEAANQRRGGESGVRLLPREHGPNLYCKRQTGHLYRTWLHPFGRPTILRELQAYRALARLGIRTPNIVYCAAQQQQGQWQALLVTEELVGFVSLEQWYATASNAGNHRLLEQLALTLLRLHQGGWQHGCCYPKHVFVKQQGNTVQIALLDLEKSRRRFNSGSAAKRDLGQLERHRGAIPEADLLYLRQTYQQALKNRKGVLLP